MIGYVANKTSETNNDRNVEIMEARKQKSPEELRKDLAELMEKTPARQYARYAYKPEWSAEYKALKNTDTSNFTVREKEEHASKLLAYKMNGGITQEQIDAEIETSMNTSLSKSFEIKEALEKEILALENAMDNFPVDEYNHYATLIGNQFKERAKGANPMYKAILESQLAEEFDKLEMQYIKVPRNEIAKARHEKLTRYRIWDSAIRLFVAENKDAIAKSIEEARNAEIKENLHSIVSYMENR